MPLSSERIRVISELENDSSPGLLRDLLVLAQKSFPEQLQQIGACLQGEEFAALRFKAHTFSGSAASLGADQVAALAMAIESWAEQPSEILPWDTFHRLQKECEMAMQDFHQLLEQIPSKGL